MKTIRLAFLILISCISFDCKKDTVAPDYSNIADPFSRWKAHGFNNYTIEQRRICFCLNGGEPVRVIVKDGQVINAVKISDGTSLSPSERIWYKTVDQLFEVINKINIDSVAVFRVEYEARYGYPVNFYVDPDSMMADEEYGYENSFLIPN